MSYDIFKQNMLSYMRNQRAIGSKEDFAKKLVQEYDSLVHRGYDSINKITVSTGNLELMESILVGVLNTAFQQSAGEHPLYTNLGPVFQAYWTGATMNLFPPPLPTAIPAPAIHIAQVSNSITNTGTWNGRDSAVIPPEEAEEVEESEFDDDSEDRFIKQAAAEAANVAEDEEEDTIQRGTAFSGFDTNFGGPKVEQTFNLNRVRRGAGQSNEARQNRGVRSGVSSLNDSELFRIAGGGLYYPALGTVDNWEIEQNLGLDQEGKPRYKFKSNPDYEKNFIKKLTYYASGVEKAARFHVDLVNLVQPAFDEIKALGLDIYITSVGGYYVRNVTGGTRLSHHAWGLGMDLNQAEYPWKTRFAEDGVYKIKYDKATKKNVVEKLRDYNEFDRGFIRCCGIIIKYGKGSLNWLTDKDPMHISLYEGTWNGVPSFAVQ